MEGVLLNKESLTLIDVNLTGFVLAYKELMYKNKELKDFYKDDNSIYLFPAIINLAFAIELAFKSLLCKQGFKLEDIEGHKLNILFSKLEKELQEEIVKKTVEMDRLKSDKLRDGIVLSESDFENKLDSNSNPFVEWRYFHEGRKILSNDIDFLEELMFALTLSKEEYERYLNRIL